MGRNCWVRSSDRDASMGSTRESSSAPNPTGDETRGDASCTDGPPLPGWSVEVDTFDNGAEVEPTANDHLAFTFDGDVDDYVAWAELPEMEDTGWHEMTVVVAAPRVTIAIDGVPYIDESLSGDFNFDAFIGFTAGTGGQTNAHLIDSLTVTESVCEE